MPDYISREEARKNLCDFCIGGELCDHKGSCNAMKAFNMIPTADVRHVVYCKDCLHYVVGELFGDMVCDYHYHHHYHMEDYDYCSKGEKWEKAND